MRKLFVVTLGALVAAGSFAPAAQARHRRMVKPAPMAMAAPMNPRIAPNGDFYATPVMGGDPMAMMMSPLAVPGAVVGGVAQPVLAVPGAVVGGVTQPVLGGDLPLLPNLTP